MTDYAWPRLKRWVGGWVGRSNHRYRTVHAYPSEGEQIGKELGEVVRVVRLPHSHGHLGQLGAHEPRQSLRARTMQHTHTTSRHVNQHDCSPLGAEASEEA